MKVIMTNWVNLIGVFSFTYLYIIIDVLIHSGTFVKAILGGLISVCLYGMMFWGLFIVSLMVLDFLIIVRSQEKLKIKLLVEWLLISIPFIYWTLKYNELAFAIAVIAFLISQFIRASLIKRYCS